MGLCVGEPRWWLCESGLPASHAPPCHRGRPSARSHHNTLPGTHHRRSSRRGEEVRGLKEVLGAGAVLVGAAGGRKGVVGSKAEGLDEGRVGGGGLP